MLVRDLANRLAGHCDGDPVLEITGVASLDQANATQIAFVSDDRWLDRAQASHAGCLLIPESFPPMSRTTIRVADARAAFARVVGWLRPRRRPAPGVHPSAIVDASAKIGERASIGPHCVIGANSVIGADVVLHANVTIYDDVRLDDRVVVHAGTVIGSDGFGFVHDGDQYDRFPQIGGVEIGADVEIGANCTIDRGALEPTHIGAGTKIDNLVHIAHNCRIGRHVIIAAQTGLAGGVTVGDRVVMAGQVGVGDKARIEAGAVLGARAGVLTAKVVPAGEPMWGTPARPLRRYLRQLADGARVSELLQKMRQSRSVRVADLLKTMTNDD